MTRKVINEADAARLRLARKGRALLTVLAVGLAITAVFVTALSGQADTSLATVMAAGLDGPTGGISGEHQIVSGPDPVLTWNANAGAAAVAACISPSDDPLHESRMYAMAHVAIHDALNAIDRRSRPYAYDESVNPNSSVDAAVAAASRDVLVSAIRELPAPFPATCIASGVARVEADYLASLTAISDGPAKSSGLAVGQAAARAILDLRSDDGSETPLIVDSYEQGTEPGQYKFTPGTPFAFAPEWGEVTPFVLIDGSQFRARAPLRLASKRYATELNEVQRLGGDGVTTSSARTADETEVALFWVESSPLAWNRIARTISSSAAVDSWGNARLFALLNVAMADGYIGTFDSKYDYNFWRPVTAIREAATDDNPETNPDPTWTPLRTTPPIPDHDSGHSVQGGVAAEVMKRFFGTDQVLFSACSNSLDTGKNCGEGSEVRRTFTSFSQAADENGLSRVLVGFHFRFAVDEGIDHGRDIGKYAVNGFFRPVGGRPGR